MNIRNLVETALKAKLDAASLGVDVHMGFSGATKSSPCVVASVTAAQEEPQQSGNFRVVCKVQTRAAYDYTEASFSALCSSVAAVIHADDMTSLSGDNLTCWGLAAPVSFAWDIEDDVWLESLDFELMAAPSALT